ncbi:MAG: hypothetical protein KTV45_14925 [Acidimicrobiia bacterium]|nr:hypothetical protein [Acidimicrobiia bacterium]
MAARDSLEVWMSRYLLLAVEGVLSEEVTAKIGLHLARFRLFLAEAYGHDRISTVVRRDVGRGSLPGPPGGQRRALLF